MPFVERDGTGRIVGASEQPTSAGLEFLDPDHPELRDFLNRSQRTTELRESLQASDVEFVRVLEDLIEVLVRRGVIALTDFPEPVRSKLEARGDLRRRYRESPLLDLREDLI
jgi:hypothetical protein